MNNQNSESGKPKGSRLNRFRSAAGLCCRINRQQAGEKSVACLLRSGLIGFGFIGLFGCFFAAAEALLFKAMSFWDVVVSALLIGTGFGTVSFVYPHKKLFRLFLWLSGPLFSMLMTEVLIGNISAFPLKINLTFTQAVLNLVWYYIIALVFYLISGRLNLSAGIAVSLSFFWGNLNYYVFRFRGRIILPSDLLSVRTALQVQDNYDWKPAMLQWAVLAVFLGYLCLLIITKERGRARPRLRFAVPVMMVCLIFTVSFFGSSFLFDIGIKPAYWYTQNNGVLLNFCTYLKYGYTEKPDGYSADIPGQSGYLSDGISGEGSEKPNIIVVMNEAFSDPGVLGQFDVNDDCMPFFRGLNENTVRGYVYSSELGGNTANAEYEFLTGNTMAFLPGGTIAYQMYTAAGDYSLSGQLSGIGYKTVAMHPFRKNCWNRTAVYRNYGFSAMYFEDDYIKKGMVRNYIGDKYNYEKLISVYEAHRRQEPDAPIFIFNVTMQNHGGYLKPWVNLNRSIYLTGGYLDKYPAVDQYLSLIRESDEAFEALVNYFAGVDKPTIIVMFGDHQPKFEEKFYYDVFKKHTADLTPDERQRMHKVPFVIWANYDIRERAGLHLSMNYLQTFVLDVAGLPLTGYQKLLRQMHENIPVINSIGFCERSLNFKTDDLTLSKAGREQLQKYRIIQYNGVFDRSNRADGFFGLAGIDNAS
ncbi:MAG: sulfatase-like hydrolase/transferase [Clostridiales bacterium]|jgi:hypothetical protein|nr:sulfatase-like hydrolase/transferase [Clostridiales bacterium]